MFMIMKKSYLLAMALAAMVSCSSDEFVGDNGSPNGVNGCTFTIGGNTLFLPAAGLDDGDNDPHDFLFVSYEY